MTHCCMSRKRRRRIEERGGSVDSGMKDCLVFVSNNQLDSTLIEIQKVWLVQIDIRNSWRD